MSSLEPARVHSHRFQRLHLPRPVTATKESYVYVCRGRIRGRRNGKREGGLHDVTAGGPDGVEVLQVGDPAEDGAANEALRLRRSPLRVHHLRHRLPLLLAHQHVGRVAQLLLRSVDAERRRQQDQPERHVHRHELPPAVASSPS